jgi:hypothetical protein
MRRFTFGLLALSLAGCSHSSGPGRSASPRTTTSQVHVASLAHIIDATRGLRTFQFATTVVGPPDSKGHRITFRIAGVSDRQGNRSWVTDAPPGGPVHEDFIIDAARFYARNMTPHLPANIAEWCWSKYNDDTQGAYSPLGISLTQTLAELAGSGRQLQYIGRDVVRGIATTHYQITRGGPTLDIWTDAQDRLRRLHGPQASDTDTTDLFNFDQPVTWTYGSDKQIDANDVVGSTTITIPTNAETCQISAP